MKKQRVSITQQGVLTVEYPTIGKKFVADTSKYPKGILHAALQHGFKQKFGDAESGKAPMDKYLMVQRIHESLLAGNWDLSPDHSGVIIEAICNLKKLKEPQVRAALEKNPEKLKEWGTNASVKAEVARIRAVNAAKVAEESDDDEIEIEI